MPGIPSFNSIIAGPTAVNANLQTQPSLIDVMRGRYTHISDVPYGSEQWFVLNENLPGRKQFGYEISDRSAELIPSENFSAFKLNNTGQQLEANLDSVIKHDALFQAYPELKTLKTVLDPSLSGSTIDAYYNPQRNTISIDPALFAKGDETKALSIILHEAQHAIDNKEGRLGTGNGSGVYQQGRDVFDPATGLTQLEHVRDNYYLDPSEQNAYATQNRFLATQDGRIPDMGYPQLKSQRILTMLQTQASSTEEIRDIAKKLVNGETVTFNNVTFSMKDFDSYAQELLIRTADR